MDGSEHGREIQGVSRRELLRRAGIVGIGAAAVGVPVGILEPGAQPAAAAVEREQLETLTSAEADTLEAILETLIPSDGSGPGAKEARVGRFIDRTLAGYLREQAGFYSAGLDATDAYAKSAYGAAFADLPADKRVAALTDIEGGKATGFVPDSTSFFAALRALALQGMFGDPYYGGNADFAGWDLISFPGIKLEFTAKEQQLDIDIKPAHKSTADFGIFGLGRRGQGDAGGGDHGH